MAALITTCIGAVQDRRQYIVGVPDLDLRSSAVRVNQSSPVQPWYLRGPVLFWVLVVGRKDGQFYGCRCCTSGMGGSGSSEFAVRKSSKNSKDCRCLRNNFILTEIASLSFGDEFYTSFIVCANSHGRCEKSGGSIEPDKTQCYRKRRGVC